MIFQSYWSNQSLDMKNIQIHVFYPWNLENFLQNFVLQIITYQLNWEDGKASINWKILLSLLDIADEFNIVLECSAISQVRNKLDKTQLLYIVMLYNLSSCIIC